MPKLVAVLAGAVLAVGGVLPWTTIEDVGWTYRGTSASHAVMSRVVEPPPFGDGWLIVGLGVLAVITAAASWRWPSVIAATAAVAVGAVAMLMFEWSELVSESSTTYYTTGGAVQIGVPVAVAGAVICLAASCTALLRRRRTRNT